MKFSMCIGGLTYNIDCLSEQFYESHGKRFACGYAPDAYSVSVDPKELENYRFYDKAQSVYTNETVFLLDRVVRHCLDYNRMMIHGAAICYDGNGYLFIAPSGTGKTTHIGLWQQYLGDKVTIINGDKPMLQFGEEIAVCGTPWNGKEGLGNNISAPLASIVVLKQSQKNAFAPLNPSSAVVPLVKQCFCSVDKECGPKVVKYIEKIVQKIPIYSLECDISKEAFELCFHSLCKA